jgi:hypothetical protein
MFRIRSIVTSACVIAAASLPLLLAQAASAAPVPASDFTCGVTDFSPCNQTAHFTDLTQQAPPAPNATGCPAYIVNDAAVITGTGNGIEHSIINNKLDGWFTTTWTGQVTIVFYTADALGNPVAVDTSAPNPVTGHLTQWFGGSFNNKNFVVHDTINFTGTDANGNPVSFHAVDHTSASAAGLPNEFHIASC